MDDNVVAVCPICSRFQTRDHEELQRHASVCGDKSRLRQLSRLASGVQTATAQPNVGKRVREKSSVSKVFTQPNTDPTPAVRAHGCYAVLGNVCWFCHRSEPTLNSSCSQTVYGGLPLLYHFACIGGPADAQTDISLFAAYKTQFAKRSADAPVSCVSLSALRSLTSLWLRNRQTEAEATKLEAPNTIEEKDCADDVQLMLDEAATRDSDDEEPLACLADESRPLGLLAARRTPFEKHTAEAFAQGVLGDDSLTLAATDSATHTDSADSGSCQPLQPPTTSVNPSPFASTDMQRASSEVQQQAAARSAAQIFESRPGFNWQYSGFVQAVPPVHSDEKRVLSHHMSSRILQRYNAAQDGASMDIKVLQFYEDNDEKIWDEKFRSKVKENTKKYLQKNMARDAWLVTNLPEDPDCSDLLEVRPIEEGDFREGLRPGVDVTVRAKESIGKGTVLGLYRNITVTKAEERVIHDNPPKDFEGSRNEWRQKLDAYTADIEQPHKACKKSRTKFADIFEGSLKNETLSCLAYMNGNILSCINDGCANPFNPEDHPDHPDDKPANVQLVTIAVGKWPFMFVVAINNIKKGEELFLSYGSGFWEFQTGWFRAIKEEKELEQKIRTSGTSTMDSQGGSQLPKTRSGPPVETAMSANHGYSKGKLEKALQHAATAPMPSLAGKQAVSQDVADPMEEDDGQEVAADNQVELQQHEESMDESDADQPEEAKSGAVVAGSPVLSAPVAEKLDEGIDHIIKKAKKEVADSPCRSRPAAAKEPGPTLPALAPAKSKSKALSGVKRLRDTDISTQSQSSSQPSAATLKPVLKGYSYDFEVAILHGSSDHQSPQQLPQLSGLDEVNDQRSFWAPPGSTDVERMSSFVQTVLRRSLAQHEQSGTIESIFQNATFAPERKALRQRQAELDLKLRKDLTAAGEEESDVMLQASRDVSQAEDRMAQMGSRSSDQQAASKAAKQAHSAQAAGSSLHPNPEHGNQFGVQQQRHLDRIGSKTGSTLTQLATAFPKPEARLRTEAMQRDIAVPQQTDRLKPPELQPRPCANQRPAGAALSKVPSVNSRAKPLSNPPAASMPETGKTAPTSAQSTQRAKGTCARMGLHGRISERPLHSKRPLGPSRLGKGKQHDAQPNLMCVTGFSDQNQRKISGSDDASGAGNVQDTAGASKGQKTASARHAEISMTPVGTLGSITTNHSASFGLKSSTTSHTQRIEHTE